jgi:ACT domain-containing protein
MVMLIDLSKSKVKFTELKNILEEKGKDIGVTIKIQRKEIFNSMYNV